MIKTIFNSFGRTLGRILCYILIGIVIAVLTGLVHVKAAERSDNFLSNIKYLPSYVQAYNWSGPNSYKSISSVKYTFGDLYPNLFNNSDDRLLYPVFNSGSVVYSIAGPLGDNGRSFVFDLPTRISKQMYTAVTTHICYSGGNMPNVSRIGAGDSYATALTTSPKYGSTNKLYFSPLTFSPNGTSLTVYCGAYFSIIQPNEQSASFHIRMDGVNNSNVVYFLMGIDVQSLGNADQVTSAQIENIVKNSGLATASSVQEVNTAVKKVQEEVSGTKSAIDDLNDQQQKNHKETMDYITDDTEPDSDISSLGTVQGLLPAGPVDSLLNIPVYFLSVLTSSMSGTCVPIEGKFIFNSNLSIPCFSTLIYDNNSIPSSLMFFINVIPSAFILIMYFKHLYKKVDRAVSMDSTADDEWGVI